MRKLIVRYFGLNYLFRFFGNTITFVRATNIIFPLFWAFAITISNVDNSPIIDVIITTLFILSVFFGFKYFKHYPLTENDWKYMSDSQKFNFGEKEKVDTEKTKEWLIIRDNILTKLEKPFYNTEVLLVKLITIIITILIIWK